MLANYALRRSRKRDTVKLCVCVHVPAVTVIIYCSTVAASIAMFLDLIRGFRTKAFIGLEL